jgi:hypothetical protein
MHLRGPSTYCCPCGPHRRATVAGLGLVGGTVRVLSGCDCNVSAGRVMSIGYAALLPLVRERSPLQSV